jgi:hypothetical protein
LWALTASKANAGHSLKCPAATGANKNVGCCLKLSHEATAGQPIAASPRKILYKLSSRQNGIAVAGNTRHTFSDQMLTTTATTKD